MVDNATNISRMKIPDSTKITWELVSKDEYPLLMLEYTRRIQDQSMITMKMIDSIRNWVIFFGVLVVIGLIVTLFNACTAFF